MSTNSMSSLGKIIADVYRNVPDVPGIAKRAHQAGWPLASLLRDIKRAYIVEVLREHHWNQCHAAAALGMHRNTLGRDLNELGISIAELRDGRRPVGKAGA